MRIQTLNRDYEILQMAESGERMDVLIARDERHPEDGKCMLIVLKQKGDIYRFLPFLADQEENKPFDDFMGYFPRDENTEYDIIHIMSYSVFSFSCI